MHHGFASDNYAGAHPAVLSAIARAAQGYAPAYGEDDITARAERALRAELGGGARIFFVWSGTAANVLGLGALLESHHAVLCAETSHIHNDECGAPEAWTGAKLWCLPHTAGKLTPETLRRVLPAAKDPHRVQPRVISISEATELGTVYRPEEIRALADIAHAHDLYLHVDGARLANAAAFLEVPLAALTSEAGVDVLSLGATKNGALGAEAVVFFRPEPAEGFGYRRKQGLQLASKHRFLSAQLDALWTDGLWLENARHANALARRLAKAVGKLPGLEILHPVEANAVFARLPRAARARLAATHHFYDWDESRGEVRWMTSFQTTEAEVDEFAAAIRAALSP